MLRESTVHQMRLPPRRKSRRTIARGCTRPGLFSAVLLCTALLNVSSSATQAPPAQTAKRSDAVVSGTVQKLADSQPIKGAHVQLVSLEDHSRSVTINTDIAGHFELRGVSAGRYRLRVSHDGFLMQEYGARKAGEAGATLALRPGQTMADLIFRMLPSAVISGRVINEDGDALPWVRVTALREGYSGGKRRLYPETTSPTNDLGEYRLFGLQPGRYLISADYRPGVHSCVDVAATDDADALETGTAAGSPGSSSAPNYIPGYVPTFYPNSPDATKAAAVTVKAGEEISSMEISVAPVSAYTVRGRVLNLVSRRAAAVTLTLAPRSSSQSFGLPGRNFSVDGPEGPFTISGVLPGAYVLFAQWFDGGTHYQALQNVDVGNADLNGATLSIAPGSVVRGHITWDGAPSMTRDSLLLFLRETDVDSAYGAAARAQSDGTFAINNVYEGTYRLSIAGQSPDAYLEAVRYGVSDGLPDGFTVRRGADAPLEVIVSSKGARVQGAVLDSDNLPAVGVWVVLVPNDPHRGDLQRYKAVTTDQNGHYLLRGVAPGDYKLFSWEDVDENAWQDPEFLRSFEDRGEKLSVEPGDQKTIDLVTIRNK
jgi:hypothetical protein